MVQADQQHEAVHEAAQRGGGVGVGRGDRGLHRVLGHLLGTGERRIGGAPEQGGGEVQQREMGRLAPVQGAQELPVLHALAPGHAEHLALAAEAVHGALLRRRHGAQDPRAVLEHQARRSHAGHQRELRVRVLYRVHAPPGQAHVVLLGHHLLLGHVQARPAALGLERGAEVTDLLQQHHHRMAPPGVELLLHPVVGELRDRADQRPLEPDPDDLAALAESQLPHEGGRGLLRQQGGDALGEHLGMQRYASVREVEGLPAPPSLVVDHTVEVDEEGHVRDRVQHPVPLRGALQVHRLVEVRGACRVQGHEGHVGEIASVRTACRGVAPRGLLGGGEHVGGELERHVAVVVRQERVDALAEVVGGDRAARCEQGDGTVRHRDLQQVGVGPGQSRQGPTRPVGRPRTGAPRR